MRQVTVIMTDPPPSDSEKPELIGSGPGCVLSSRRFFFLTPGFSSNHAFSGSEELYFASV
jgi:hypothetical protein